MKTAMQELIKILEDVNHLWNPRNNQDDNDTYLHCIDEAQKLLEKEKEQIIDAMGKTAMYVSAASLDKEIGKMNFEDLYNQIYNLNK
jgi:hypothetical protein